MVGSPATGPDLTAILVLEVVGSNWQAVQFCGQLTHVRAFASVVLFVFRLKNCLARHFTQFPSMLMKLLLDVGRPDVAL